MPLESQPGGAPPWWAGAVVYEIYLRSFQDSDGDGVGDLKGVLARLDHIESLGVDAVWLTPFYPSPMADFGYDISDFTAVDPLFGTMDDLDAVIAALHSRGIRVLFDLVPNHSSDAHPWFVEARRSRASPKRDWYVWCDPAPDGGPPNNWPSQAGGSAWTLDEASGQYYLHTFLAAQPDLNWRNPAVRRAMHEVVRFWLARGVNGFRIDVLWYLIKDEAFRDDPANPDFRPGDPPFKRLIPLHSADAPGILETAAELSRVIKDGDAERLVVAELTLPLERRMAYHVAVDLPFNFDLIWASWTPEMWTAPAIGKLIQGMEDALPEGAWPNWVTGNHDQPRVATRLGEAQARIAMMLLLTLRGTATLYAGEELGLDNVDIPLERVRDPFGLNMPGTGQGRDPVRTPMVWDASEGAGFTTGEPWLPVGEGHRALNAEVQARDPRSMLTLTRWLMRLRRAEPALRHGSWKAVEAPPAILAYERATGPDRILVLLNLTSKPASVASSGTARLLLSSHLDRQAEMLTGDITLRADEGLVLRLA